MSLPLKRVMTFVGGFGAKLTRKHKKSIPAYDVFECISTMDVLGGNGRLPPWKLGLRTKSFQRTWSQQLNSDQLTYLLQSQIICRYGTHTAQEPGSLFWRHAVENVEFTPYVRYFACKVRLQNLPANCSTVGVNCVPINWQQTFKGSLQVTVADFAACDCWTQISFTGNAGRRDCWYSSSTPRSFMLCEKKREWKRSIAAPTKRNFCYYCCKHRAFSLWCVKGKAFCECPFALHRQQPEKDKQNVDVALPLEKILRTPMIST